MVFDSRINAANPSQGPIWNLTSFTARIGFRGAEYVADVRLNHPRVVLNISHTVFV